MFCTKCVTACDKSTQHKLDQLLSCCHEYTAASLGSVRADVCYCCCFLQCRSNMPSQSCVPLIRQTAKAQLARLAPIRNTKYMLPQLKGCGYRCSTKGWRQNATILQQQSLIDRQWGSSEETWLLLQGRAQAGLFLHTLISQKNTACLHTRAHRHRPAQINTMSLWYSGGIREGSVTRLSYMRKHE